MTCSDCARFRFFEKRLAIISESTSEHTLQGFGRPVQRAQINRRSFIFEKNVN
jgi:hypothetical protein